MKLCIQFTCLSSGQGLGVGTGHPGLGLGLRSDVEVCVGETFECGDEGKRGMEHHHPTPPFPSQVFGDRDTFDEVPTLPSSAPVSGTGEIGHSIGRDHRPFDL